MRKLEASCSVSADVSIAVRARREAEHGPRLYANLLQLLSFLAVGLTGVVVDVAALAVLLLVLPIAPARALAIWVAMTWNFALNRRFTFAKARDGSWWRAYLGFCGSCLLGALVNWSVSMSLCKMLTLFASHRMLAAVLGAVSGAAWNYLLCRHFVFRERKASPVAVARGDCLSQRRTWPNAKSSWPGALGMPCRDDSGGRLADG